MGMSIKSGYGLANGVNLYYEIHGTGEPLILLHAGQLAILPGLTHYNIGSSPALATVVAPFLDESARVRATAPSQ